MKLANLFSVMKLGDSNEPNTYLCDDPNHGYYWGSSQSSSDNLCGVSAGDFTFLAHWYWDTFRGEIPLTKWASDWGLDVPLRLIEISEVIDEVVFCGYKIHMINSMIMPLKVYEPSLNQCVADHDVYKWVKAQRQ